MENYTYLLFVGKSLNTKLVKAILTSRIRKNH